MTSGGLLGVWGKWVKHAKYIYNIQDFNPEQVLAVGYTKSKFITDAMMWFDKFSCKRSDLVITVGRDLVETVENRFKGKKVPKTVMINNWIDENEIYPLDESNERVVAFKKKYGLDGKFVIMYSGNIGLYYDLENLIKVVEKFKAGTKTADNVGISGATIYARKKITIGENTCISCGTRNQPSRSSGRLSGAAYSSGVSSSSARVRVWNTSTPPSTGWATTYAIQRRPCSAGFGLPRILIVLPDGGKMVCIAVLLLLIHPVVSYKCGFRFHVAAQPVQRHAAAQPIHQSQRFLCPNRGTWAVALLAEHG